MRPPSLGGARRRHVALAAALAGTFFVPPAAAAPGATPVTLHLPPSSVQLAVPPGWKARPQPPGWLLAGPEEGPAAYTTVALQEIAGDGQPLVTLLEEGLAPLLALPDFAWISRGPLVAGGSVGVLAVAQFELHELPRYLAALIVSLGARTLSLTYTAPYATAEAGLGAFLEVVDSLAL